MEKSRRPPKLLCKLILLLQKLGIHHCQFCHTWFFKFRPKPFQIIHHCKLNWETWFGSTPELNKLKKWQVFLLGWCAGAISLLIIMGVMNYILGITFIQK